MHRKENKAGKILKSPPPTLWFGQPAPFQVNFEGFDNFYLEIFYNKSYVCKILFILFYFILFLHT